MIKAITPIASLKEGQIKRFQVNGTAVLLACLGETYKVIYPQCPHQGFPMDKANISGGSIACPMHNFAFSLDTGECQNEFVICDALPVVDAVIEDGQVCIDLNAIADWQ